MTVSPETLTLIGAQKAAFNLAARQRTWIIRVQVAIALIAVVTVPGLPDLLLYFAALLALVLTAVWFGLSEQLYTNRSHAERLRRTTMLMGGLGFQIPGAYVLELIREGAASREEAERLVDPDYFASKLPYGPNRLAEMLEESAIWTANLAKFASREAWLIFGGTGVVLIFTLLAAVAVVQPSQWQIGARIVVIVLTSILSADFIGSARKYSSARQEAIRIIDKLQPHKSGDASLEQVTLIFSDYNSAVESMPPFSSGLYPRHQKRLNEEYKMYLTGPK